MVIYVIRYASCGGRPQMTYVRGHGNGWVGWSKPMNITKLALALLCK